MRRCIHCNDTGVCKYCNGTGKNRGGRLDCMHCNGTGVCKHCGGNEGQSPQQQTMGGFQQSIPPPQQSNFQQQPMGGLQSNFQQQPMGGQTTELQDLSPEQQLEAYIDAMQKGGMVAKMLSLSFKSFRKFGMGVSELARPLLNKFQFGTDREKMVCAEIVGKLGEGAAGTYEELGKLLEHPNEMIRAKAMEAIDNLGKYAVTVESYLKHAMESDDSKKIQKSAKKLLKKLDKKVSGGEKLLLIEEEQNKRKILEEVKEIENSVKNVDASKLSPKTDNFNQYKNVFFMSHALPDFPWVEKVINEISSWPGCYCWTCERDIQPGEDWLTEIYDGLDKCNWYILFWSDKAENSKWTNEEMREVKVRNVDKGRPKISVVNLGKEDWPKLLARHQGAVVTSDDQLQDWLANLKTQVDLS